MVEDRQLGYARHRFANRSRRRLVDAIDRLQIVECRPLDLGQAAEMSGDTFSNAARKTFHAVEIAQSLGRDLLTQIVVVAVATEDTGGNAQVKHVVIGQLGHLAQDVFGNTSGRQVVDDDEVEFVVDLAVQLIELQAKQSRVESQLDDHCFDLVGDSVHHFTTLHDSDDVAQRGDIFYFDGGEISDRIVKFCLVTLECLQRLICSFEQVTNLLELPLVAARIDVNNAHLLTRRYDVDIEGTCDALSSAVAGAGLARWHGGIRDEVHIGSGNATAFG